MSLLWWRMRLLPITNGFLCVGMIVFPFSVGLSNVMLTSALLIGIISGLLWQGVKVCWSEFRALCIAFWAYYIIFLLGLLWSQDFGWGVHILGRHWFWLLLPILVASLAEDRWRRYFLTSVSAGLVMHLMYCVLQSFGYMHVATVIGSGADNATGHIGHIGFGVVYGIWAAWLLFLGWYTDGKLRWLYWALAGWTYLMIFLAQGRSGYIVAFVLALAVAVKYFSTRGNWKKMLLIGSLALVLLTAVLAIGPAKERLQGTWMAVTGQQQNDGSFWQKNAATAASYRIEMWQTTLDIYLKNPLFGVGTGGLPHAVTELKAEGRSSSQYNFTHPHNQYLLSLVRWGPAGPLLFSLFLWFWMRQGWSPDWREYPEAPLIFLPALAIAIHALSSSSLEEHFSAILAVLLLGTGLSGNRDQIKTGGEK